MRGRPSPLFSRFSLDDLPRGEDLDPLRSDLERADVTRVRREPHLDDLQGEVDPGPVVRPDVPEQDHRVDQVLDQVVPALVLLNLFLSPPVVINIWSILISAIGGIVGVIIVLVLHFLGIAF